MSTAEDSVVLVPETPSSSSAVTDTTPSPTEPQDQDGTPSLEETHATQVAADAATAPAVLSETAHPEIDAEHVEHAAEVVAEKSAAGLEKVGVEMSVSRQEKIRNSTVEVLMKTEILTEKLDRLFLSTATLESTLSTLNYTTYLLNGINNSPLFIKFKSTIASLLRSLLALILRRTSKPTPTLAVPQGKTKLSALASLISDFRNTLRLVGVIPMIPWTLSTLRNPNPDPFLQSMAVTQCFSIILYQVLENVVVLSRKGVISKKILGDAKGELKWEFYSTRFWLVYVVAELARVYRDNQLLNSTPVTSSSSSTLTESEKIQTSSESSTAITTDAEAEGTRLAVQKALAERQKKKDALRASAVSNAAWLPLCVHWSLESGVPPFGNEAVMGLFGLVAGLGGFRRAWKSVA